MPQGYLRLWIYLLRLRWWGLANDTIKNRTQLYMENHFRPPSTSRPTCPLALKIHDPDSSFGCRASGGHRLTLCLSGARMGWGVLAVVVNTYDGKLIASEQAAPLQFVGSRGEGSSPSRTSCSPVSSVRHPSLDLSSRIAPSRLSPNRVQSTGGRENRPVYIAVVAPLPFPPSRCARSRTASSAFLPLPPPPLVLLPFNRLVSSTSPSPSPRKGLPAWLPLSDAEWSCCVREAVRVRISQSQSKCCHVNPGGEAAGAVQGGWVALVGVLSGCVQRDTRYQAGETEKAMRRLSNPLSKRHDHQVGSFVNIGLLK
ncbi:hypothetical protein Vafri_13351 [Volvox africanus]|nr:hypothetical protein Vafri_13351 [Volvox africanus]